MIQWRCLLHRGSVAVGDDLPAGFLGEREGAGSTASVRPLCVAATSAGGGVSGGGASGGTSD